MEAVQFRDWRPWHAVRPEPDENRTFCGIKVLGAKRMWETWDDKDDRCKQCVYVIQAKERHDAARA